MGIQLANLITSSAAAYIFTTDPETLIIARGIIVSSSGNDAIEVSTDHANLFNNGSIFSGAGDGIKVDNLAFAASIVNEIDEIIDVTSHGVSLDGSNATFTNYGRIAAVNSGVDLGGFANVAVNYGNIFGGISGVRFDSGGRLENHGTIQSHTDGIFVFASGTATIINSGTISGVSDGIDCFAGSINLQNSGILNGDIVCSPPSEADTVTNSGRITGPVSLGGGNDTFDGTGGTSGAVNGGAGDDKLTGGAAADSLNGNIGNDTLKGAGGRDHFVFNSALSASTNVDRVLDLVHGVDKIDLGHFVFTAVGPAGASLAASKFFVGAHAHDASDRIIYNSATGALFYDQDGNQTAHAQVKFAVLSPHLPLSNGDFLIV